MSRLPKITLRRPAERGQWRARVLAWSLAVALCPAAAGTERIVGRFDAAGTEIPAPWQVIRLERSVPPTTYRLVDWDGVTAIEARAHASMALLGRPVSLDLQATPVLCWRWRVDAALKSADMARRRGDDYAARVYVAFALPADELGMGDKVGLRLARMMYGDKVPDAAINYVWDNRYPVGTRRPNAYTDRAQMLVLRSGNAEAGQWVSERVDLRDDVRQVFGSTRARPVLVAVGSDTDNTGETARAGFADLHAVAAGEPCAFER